MSLWRSKSYLILEYVQAHPRITRGELARLLNITYGTSTYHLEKLLSRKLLIKEKFYTDGLWSWLYSLVPVIPERAPEPYIGLVVVYNFETHKSKGKPAPKLDITVQIQTVIKREEERSVVLSVDRIALSWFMAKFGNRQGAMMKPEASIDYFEPTVSQMEKFYQKIYAYFWRFIRGEFTTPLGVISGRTQQGSGEEKQWDELPTEYETGTGATEWSESERGRKKRLE